MKGVCAIRHNYGSARCFCRNSANNLEVVVGGHVLEEVTLLLHDAVELVDVNLTIAITVGLVDHILELLVVDALTELLGNTGEVAEGDLVGVVVVEQLEDLLDVLAGVLLAHLAGHHLEELAELDGPVTVVVDVSDHLLELFVLDLETKGTHGSLELADIDLKARNTGSIKHQDDKKNCPRCGGGVFSAEEIPSKGRSYHKKCATCISCEQQLTFNTVYDGEDNEIYCKFCYHRKYAAMGYRGAGCADWTDVESNNALRHSYQAF